MERRTFVGGGILGIESSNPLNEGLHPALLEDTHQRGLEGFASIGWDLGDGGLGTGTLLDVAASNLLELEVTSDVGRHEDVGQLARGHEELGDQINVPVVHTAVLLPGLLAGLVVAILLEELYVEDNIDQISARECDRTMGGHNYRLEVNGGGLSVGFSCQLNHKDHLRIAKNQHTRHSGRYGQCEGPFVP